MPLTIALAVLGASGIVRAQPTAEPSMPEAAEERAGAAAGAAATAPEPGESPAEPAAAASDSRAGSPEERAPSLADMPWIEDVPLPERARAREIFLQGNLLLEDTLFASAAAKYEQALAIWAHPSFHYNLALARIHLDQPIAAYASMQQAVRYGQAPLGEDLYKNAQSFLKLLRGQLAEIEVVCDQPGASVTLDGKPLFECPGRRTLMALPGGHMLMATAAGRLPDTQQIVLEPGQQARFSLAPSAPDRLVARRRWPAWIPWTITGAGLAIAAGGAMLDRESSAAFDRYDRAFDDLCAGSRGCEPGAVPAALNGQLDAAHGRQRMARITYAIGGAVIATGAVLLYLNRERLVRRPGGHDMAGALLVPALVPGALGASARIHF